MRSRVFLVLFLRSVLVLSLQCLFASIYFVLGSSDAWRMGADWWVYGITITNIVCILLISKYMSIEGDKYSDLWKFDKTELLGSLLFWVVAIPLSLLPNIILGIVLWGNPQVGADLSFRSLPIFLVIPLILVFPVTQAMAELPVYFGYVMPRLEGILKSRVISLVICSFVLSFQHIFLPLLFDWRFIIWRAFMFLPLAFWMGYWISKHPKSFPYLMVGHGLIDASLPVMILIASLV